MRIALQVLSACLLASGMSAAWANGGGGMSTGAKVAIVAVIAGGAIGAGVALASKKSSTSP